MSDPSPHPNCYLTAPSERYEDSFLEAAAEFHKEGRLDSTYAEFLGYDLIRMQGHFRTFVCDLQNLSGSGGHGKSGYSDQVCWLIDGEDYIGQASIRPELGTPYLITYGGHIGYSIRPSRRRRGYGTRILELAIEKCPSLGLEQVLVTCDSDNIASKKIIERNGGRFESAMTMAADVLRAEGRASDKGLQKLRFWIDLSAVPERKAL